MKKYIDKSIYSINQSKKLKTRFDKIYDIDINLFGISNDNTNATSTTEGINKALIQAKSEGYNRARLPQGHYAIDTGITKQLILNPNTDAFRINAKGIII